MRKHLIIPLALLALISCRSARVGEQSQHTSTSVDSLCRTSSQVSGTLIEHCDTVSSVSHLTVTYVSTSEDFDTLGRVLHRTQKTATLTHGAQTSQHKATTLRDSVCLADSAVAVSHTADSGSRQVTRSGSTFMDNVRAVFWILFLAVAMYFVGRYSKTILGWLVRI